MAEPEGWVEGALRSDLKVLPPAMDLLEDWNNIVSDDVANPNAEDDPDIFDLALLRDFMSR